MRRTPVIWPPTWSVTKDPPSPNDTPHLGSVVARLRATSGGLPPFVMMPWKVFHPSAPGGVAPVSMAVGWGRPTIRFWRAGDPSKPGGRFPNWDWWTVSIRDA